MVQLKRLRINIEKTNDDDIDLIKRIKDAEFTNGHRFKQCYLESNKLISDNWICWLPCDVYCPNRIKFSRNF
jgi:hypothetical protein